MTTSLNIWHFNNDTKAWSFYDGMEGSDLSHLITGETYLLQVKSTVEVILNNDTRNLTCVGSQLLEPDSLVRQGQE